MWKINNIKFNSKNKYWQWLAIELDYIYGATNAAAKLLCKGADKLTKQKFIAKEQKQDIKEFVNGFGTFYTVSIKNKKLERESFKDNVYYLVKKFSKNECLTLIDGKKLEEI